MGSKEYLHLSVLLVIFRSEKTKTMTITLFCSVQQQTGTDQNRKSKIKEETTILRTRTESHQGTTGEMQQELKERGVSRPTSGSPVRWSVLQFLLLCSLPRRISKPGNTPVEIPLRIGGLEL